MGMYADASRESKATTDGLEDLIDIKRIRLRQLQEDCEEAMADGKISKAIRIISAARREVEGPPIRRRKERGDAAISSAFD